MAAQFPLVGYEHLPSIMSSQEALAASSFFEVSPYSHLVLQINSDMVSLRILSSEIEDWQQCWTSELLTKLQMSRAYVSSRCVSTAAAVAQCSITT